MNKWLYILCCAVCCCGCSSRGELSADPTVGADGMYRASVEARLPSSASKAVSAADEKSVQNLWILQFDASGADGSLLVASYTTQVQVEAGVLKVETKLKAGPSMQVVLVANTYDSELFDEAHLPLGSTRAAFEAITQAVSSTQGQALPSDAHTTLPMTGRTAASGIALPTPDGRLAMSIRPAASKFSLSFDLSQLPDGATFEPKKAQLCRVPKLYSFGTPAAGSVWPAADPTLYTDYDEVVVDASSNLVWYLAPNVRGTGTANQAALKTAATAPAGQGDYCTYFETVGIYQDSPEEPTVEVTYRLWLGDNAIDDYNVWAGSHYSVVLVPRGARTYDARTTVYSDGFLLALDDQDSYDNSTQWLIPPPYIKVDSLLWAKGNLIAKSSTAGPAGDGACGIGEPTDGGLYFQFGSLIGWKGGAKANNGTGQGIPPAAWNDGYSWWNGAGSWSWANDAMIWPTTLKTEPFVWNKIVSNNLQTLIHYFFNYSFKPYNTDKTDIRGFKETIADEDPTCDSLGVGRYAALGVGDPCTYYLGADWRLPRMRETNGLRNKGVSPATTYQGVGGRWVGPSATSANPKSQAIFIPISGYREANSGKFVALTTIGYAYTNTAASNTGTGSSRAYALQMGTGFTNGLPVDLRSYAYPVRCVKQVEWWDKK